VKRALSILAVLTFPSVSFSQTDNAAPLTSDGGPLPLREVSGEIKDVDRGRNRLTVSARDLKLVLRVDAATTIFIEGHTGSLADLSPGQLVRAVYEEVAGAHLAQWIELSGNRAKLPGPGRGGN
jgi:hypothetical protein